MPLHPLKGIENWPSSQWQIYVLIFLLNFCGFLDMSEMSLNYSAELLDMLENICSVVPLPLKADVDTVETNRILCMYM